ncbi:hypothetical protein AAEX63_02100 [Luteococcus sp. H138]|uniref:hypothetical protein n=1 Tax=unclassified Luteococcus TaxID=2639923 RepID=UPI00313D931B
MFCARCGRKVEASATTCPACAAELSQAGAIRLTSAQEPGQDFSEIFPEVDHPPTVALTTNPAQAPAADNTLRDDHELDTPTPGPGSATGAPSVAGAPSAQARPAPPPGSWAAFDLIRERHGIPSTTPQHGEWEPGAWTRVKDWFTALAAPAPAASAATGDAVAGAATARPVAAERPADPRARDLSSVTVVEAHPAPIVGLAPAATTDAPASRDAEPGQGALATAGSALQATGSALKQRGTAMKDRGADLMSGAAITTLPSLAWITAKPRSARDSLRRHRRTQLVLALCFGAGLLALALMVSVAPLMRHIGPLKMSPVGGASHKASAKKKATITPTPTPTPTPSEDTSDRATTLPGSAKVCTTAVGASQSTSCGLAKAVQQALPDKPKGTFQLKATSPVSGTTYDFSCTADRLIVCSRGTSVRVYIIY